MLEKTPVEANAFLSRPEEYTNAMKNAGDLKPGSSWSELWNVWLQSVASHLSLRYLARTDAFDLMVQLGWCLGKCGSHISIHSLDLPTSARGFSKVRWSSTGLEIRNFWILS